MCEYRPTLLSALDLLLQLNCLPGLLCHADVFVPLSLVVEPTRIASGSDELLIFNAAFARAPTGTVNLHASDAAGAVGDFLTTLYDDGSFTHRDDVAGDVFSNVLSAQGGAPGSIYHVAVVEGATAGASVSVTTVRRLSEAEVAAVIAQAGQLQGQLNNLLLGGTPTDDALAQVRVWCCVSHNRFAHV